jgi:hypothetical protein
MLGCARANPTLADYKETIGDGVKKIGFASELKRLFPDAKLTHSIVHYGFAPGPRKWQSMAYFGGRYELGIEVMVEINYKTNEIVRTIGPATFYLVEVSKVSKNSNGSVGARFGAQTKFGEEEWKKVIDAKGDFAAIHFSINPAPLDGFQDYVEANTRDVVDP